MSGILSRGGGVLSQHALQVVSQHALQQVSKRGVVSQHALQVSRPPPRGEVEGDLARGVSRPTPGGVCSGGGVPAPGGLLWGRSAARGVPVLEGACSKGGLLPGGCGDPPGTATAAGGTHPTGMHSCFMNTICSLNWFAHRVQIVKSLHRDRS